MVNEYKKENSTLKITIGDITKQQTDAVADAGNKSCE